MLTAATVAFTMEEARPDVSRWLAFRYSQRMPLDFAVHESVVLIAQWPAAPAAAESPSTTLTRSGPEGVAKVVRLAWISNSTSRLVPGMYLILRRPAARFPPRSFVREGVRLHKANRLRWRLRFADVRRHGVEILLKRS